jgi:hypothetical protein
VDPVDPDPDPDPQHCFLLQGACPHLDHLNVEGSWGVGNQGLAALAGKDGGMVRRRKDDILYFEKKKSRNLISFWEFYSH